MTRDEFDAVCARLPHATHVVQWGDASVWKIGGKVFAIGGWSGPAAFAVTFKCLPDEFRRAQGPARTCGRPPISPRAA